LIAFKIHVNVVDNWRTCNIFSSVCRWQSTHWTLGQRFTAPDRRQNQLCGEEYGMKINMKKT